MCFGWVLRQHKAVHDLDVLTPCLLQRLQLATMLVFASCQNVGQAGTGQLSVIGHFAQQAFDIRLQALHRRPYGEQIWQVLRRKAVTLLPPIVLHRLGQQGLLIGHQLFVKQTATVKGMVTQHALTPSVDGVHAGLVHAFSRHRQAPSILLQHGSIGVRSQQIAQKAVIGPRLRLASETASSLEQAGPNALGQLTGGRAGESHHQNVGRHQGPRKSGSVTAVAQHQPDIQGGNRPSFAGARAGLNQSRAPQGKLQRVEW